MPSTLATRNPVNAQPIAPNPCSSRAAVGSAAATAIASKAISVTRMRIPALVMRWRGPKIDSSVGASAWPSADRRVVTRPGCPLKPT